MFVPDEPQTERSTALLLLAPPPCQVPPTRWRMTPGEPTAQTSASETGKTSWMSSSPCVSSGLQRTPSKWSTVPPGPTAQRSPAPRPARPKSGVPCGIGFAQHQPCKVQVGAAQTPGTPPPPQTPLAQVPQPSVAPHPSENEPQVAPSWL